MEARSLSHLAPGPSDDVELSSSMTRLTPDSDPDSDLDMGGLGESFKLQRRGRDAEKHAARDEGGDEDDEEYPRRRASVSTTQSFQLYTPDEERAVVRKLDRKLVVFVALLYMLSFLDRSSTAAFSCL